jgi:hypothetical protein
MHEFRIAPGFLEKWRGRIKNSTGALMKMILTRAMNISIMVLLVSIHPVNPPTSSDTHRASGTVSE